MPSRRFESQEGRLLYVLSYGGEKIKLEEEVICEILVAGTDSESAAEINDFEEEEEEEKKEEEKNEKEEKKNEEEEEMKGEEE